MKSQNRVAILTLGCAKNVVDSENLIKMLLNNGIEVTNEINKVDTCIINTCGFIKPAVEENLKVLLEVVNLKNQNKLRKVIVFGCLVERFQDYIKKEFPEIDFFVGTERPQEIVKYLVQKQDLKANLLGERTLLTPNHYAYLKISEGCNRECSFCVIPKIRGKLRSKPIEEIVREGIYVANKGVKELIIISQDTTSYGLDIYGKPMLIPLMDELSKIDGIEWIRIMYLYPAGIPDGFFEFISSVPKFCRYFDIPLQHISDRILKSMRRGTSKRNIVALVEKIRSTLPSYAIRTTFIVGYPGETEKEFRELLEFISDYQFERVGVFAYSREDGSYSFSFGDTVSEEEKEARRGEILKMQSKISLKKNKLLVGKHLKIVIDEKNNGYFVGRTEFDAPEVDNLVYLKSNRANFAIGEFVNAKILSAKPYDLLAEI